MPLQSARSLQRRPKAYSLRRSWNFIKIWFQLPPIGATLGSSGQASLATRIAHCARQSLKVASLPESSLIKRLNKIPCNDTAGYTEPWFARDTQSQTLKLNRQNTAPIWNSRSSIHFFNSNHGECCLALLELHWFNKRDVAMLASPTGIKFFRNRFKDHLLASSMTSLQNGSYYSCYNLQLGSHLELERTDSMPK